MDEKTLNSDRRVTDADQALQASTSRVVGWTFSVPACLDQSRLRRPIGTSTPQCAYFALVFASGEWGEPLR